MFKAENTFLKTLEFSSPSELVLQLKKTMTILAVHWGNSMTDSIVSV